jgi:hypothetical protein
MLFEVACMEGEDVIRDEDVSGVTTSGEDATGVVSGGNDATGMDGVRINLERGASRAHDIYKSVYYFITILYT